MKEKIYIRDFIRLLLNYKWSIMGIMLISTLCMIQLSSILPKTFRSEFELNIYSNYFKNALISEVIPGMNSIAEMTQTTDSMVKETLNDQFIDEIGYDFNIYPEGLDTAGISKERQRLRDRFQMFSTGGQSYKVTFSHRDPNVTYEVTQKVMEAVRNTFINTRLETIENAKKTIVQKLESLRVTKQMSEDSISVNALASKNPDVLRTEINKINADLDALKLQFNTQHPRIVKLEQRRSTLQSWLSEIEAEEASKIAAMRETQNVNSENSEYADSPLLMVGDKEISQNITSKMFTKFNDINVALDIERKSLSGYIGVIAAPQVPTAPLFPKKRLFASLGLLIGLVLCFGYVFVKEVTQLTPVEKAQAFAANLRTEYMGVLPHIDERTLMTGTSIVWDNIKQVEAPSNSKYYDDHTYADYEEVRH